MPEPLQDAARLPDASGTQHRPDTATRPVVGIVEEVAVCGVVLEIQAVLAAPDRVRIPGRVGIPAGQKLRRGNLDVSRHHEIDDGGSLVRIGPPATVKVAHLRLADDLSAVVRGLVVVDDRRTPVGLGNRQRRRARNGGMEVRSTHAEVPRLVGRRRKRHAQFDVARPRQREPRRAQRKRVFGDKRNGGGLVLEADSTQGEITRKDVPTPMLSYGNNARVIRRRERATVPVGGCSKIDTGSIRTAREEDVPRP